MWQRSFGTIRCENSILITFLSTLIDFQIFYFFILITYAILQTEAFNEAIATEMRLVWGLQHTPYAEVNESWEEGWSVLAGGYWIPVRLGRRSQSFGTGTERATVASVSADELTVLAERKVPILLEPPIDPRDYGLSRLVRTPMHQLAYARAGTEDIDIDFAADAVRRYRAIYSDDDDSYDTDSSGDDDDEEDQDESSNTGYCVETCNWCHSDFGRTRAFIGTTAMSALETKYLLNIIKAS
jgi:hypothetical protein